MVGEPIWESKKKCPEGVYIKRDFRWYETLSRRMLAEIREVTTKAEYYSVDEFFWEGHAFWEFPGRGPEFPGKTKGRT
ncbi:MAG TPA: hypothetical protein VGJ05_06550 [Fimbriiglobus sp.]|jgi:DNA polymerase V